MKYTEQEKKTITLLAQAKEMRQIASDERCAEHNVIHNVKNRARQAERIA